MDRAKVELPLLPSGLCSDFQSADGVRASRIELAVEDGHADECGNKSGVKRLLAGILDTNV